MEHSSTIEINIDDLAVLNGGDGKRLPLSSLGASSRHIHGVLEIKIKGRVVPFMGYCGRNDVCFLQWMTALKNIREKFKGNIYERYIFDEGEQGQPAFLFERHNDSMYLSIVDSEISDGEADPDWQKIEFTYQEFVSEYDELYENFVAILRNAAPQTADQWIEALLPQVN